MCRLPAPRWQRTEPVPSVVPLCYDAEWMAIQKAPEMVWHVVGKGGSWEISINWKMMKGESKERGYKYRQLGSHYNGFLVRRFLQCGSLGCLVQVNHQHLGSAQMNEVWKRILGNRLGCIQFGHSSQHAVNKYRTCFTCSNLSIFTV